MGVISLEGDSLLEEMYLKLLIDGEEEGMKIKQASNFGFHHHQVARARGLLAPSWAWSGLRPHSAMTTDD